MESLRPAQHRGFRASLTDGKDKSHNRTVNCVFLKTRNSATWLANAWRDDVPTRQQRSRCMAAIRSKHTKPEIIVRALLRQLGCRYVLHRKTLPGKPDILISGQKKVIFVHGCFWHMHRCRYGMVIPATNAAFWRKKRQGNVQRDRQKLLELRKAGWKVLTVWECWTRTPAKLAIKLADFTRA
jgi:DNA mismatch endonuclease, patch repair protein